MKLWFADDYLIIYGFMHLASPVFELVSLYWSFLFAGVINEYLNYIETIPNGYLHKDLRGITYCKAAAAESGSSAAVIFFY